MPAATTSPAPGDRAPRVLHLVTSDAFAGIERQVVSLSRALRAKGCRAELACPPSAHRLRTAAAAAGVPVVPSTAGSSRTWLLGLVRDTLTDRPVVLHVHDGRSALVGAGLSRVAGGLFVRSQHFVHTATLDRTGVAKRMSLVAHRRLNNQLDGYVAVSQAVADAGRARRETGRALVTIIPPAIDLPSPDAVDRAREARRALAGRVVVFAGRLEPERQLDVLLRAIPLVRAELPDCHLLLAGSGSAERELQQLSVELGIGDAITWAGWVPDTYDVLANAHAYVNTWPREAFGMAMAEAMAIALPVIAVDAGANSEMVDDGTTGYLARESDPRDLARAIVRQLTDRARAAEMGEAARLHALATFGAAATATATLALYETLGLTTPT